MQIREAAGWNLEESDGVADGVGRTTAGAGDVDGVEFTLKYQEPAEAKPRTEHSIWNYLLTHSDAGTVNRLRSDPAFQVDPRLLTVQLNEEGTRGFSVSVEQLLRERALWVPDLDVFLAAGDELIAFQQHQAAIQPYAGQRILDQLEREPEATYEQYTALGGPGQPCLSEPAFRPARTHRRGDLGQRHSKIRHRPVGRRGQRLRQSRQVQIPVGPARLGVERPAADRWSAGAEDDLRAFRRASGSRAVRVPAARPAAGAARRYRDGAVAEGAGHGTGRYGSDGEVESPSRAIPAGRGRSRPPRPHRARRGNLVAPRAVFGPGRGHDFRRHPHKQVRHRGFGLELACHGCQGDRPQAAVAVGRGGRPRDPGRTRLRRRPLGHVAVLGRLPRSRGAVPGAGAGRQRSVSRQPVARLAPAAPARRPAIRRAHGPALLELCL